MEFLVEKTSVTGNRVGAENSGKVYQLCLGEVSGVWYVPPRLGLKWTVHLY